MIKFLVGLGLLYGLYTIGYREGYVEGYREGRREETKVEIEIGGRVETDFTWIVPCVEGECRDADIDYYIESAEEYWKEYGIDLTINKKEIEFTEEPYLGLYVHSHGISNNIVYGLQLARELQTVGNKIDSYIINASIYEDAEGTLAYAYGYQQVMVVGQQMLDNRKLSREQKASVVIHEIGHLFGLVDIYEDGTCNMMYGMLFPYDKACDVLTAEQVDTAHAFVKEHLNVLYD